MHIHKPTFVLAAVLAGAGSKELGDVRSDLPKLLHSYYQGHWHFLGLVPQAQVGPS